MADDIEFGVNFETGEITRPAPETPPQGETDTEFNAFDDEPAGTDPQGKPQAPPPAEESIPRYRFDEVNQRLQQSAERERKLLEFIDRISQQPQQQAQPTAPAAPPSPQDAAKERIRQQLLAVVPEFGEFMKIRDKIPQLLSAAEAIPRIQNDTERYWGTVAESALNGVVAKLGESLGQTLDPRSMLGRIASQSFFEFVASNPQAQARYEAQDQSLVTEFMAKFDKEVLAPARARQVQQQRVEQVRRLPVAGRTSPPPSAQPPKPNMDNEDEVFGAAWSVVQNARQGMGQ